MDDQPPSSPPPFPPQNFGTPPLPPPPVISTPYSRPPRNGGCGVWKVLAIVFIVLFCLTFFSRLLHVSQSMVFTGSGGTHHRGMERDRYLEEYVIEHTNSDNKIAVIKVDGIITGGEADHSGMSLVEYIGEQLKSAGNDTAVKAIILKVNSPGGEVLASDDINKAIRKYQDQSHKPVVASMGALAASGGYYVSAPCHWIVANELTITGSIGVIMHGYNYRLLMDKIGIRPHVYKSGRFKDMLSGEKEPDSDKLTPEEQKTRDEEDQMVQGLIDETYNKFKDVVRSGRHHAADENDGKGRALADNWEEYADGRVLSGKQALDLGFVDELGDFDVAVKRAEKLANISSAELVEYRVPFDFGSVISHLFGKTEAPGLKIDLGFDLPRLEAGRMYFIAPTTILH